MSYELEGTVQVIMDPMTFPSGFAKREFVVEKEDKFPQPIKFTTIKEKMALIETLQVGQRVKVFFDIRGNENNGRYFVDLNCWKLEAAQGGGAPAGSPPPSESFDEGGPTFSEPPADYGQSPGSGGEDDEEVPF